MLATFTVTTLSDTGAGSLRAAIAQSNITAGDDIVEFSRDLDGGTISLTSGQITISDAIEIRGPRADLMSITANDSSRIFFVDDGDFGPDETVIISDLELREGLAPGGLTGDGGGAIFSAENLTLDRVTIRDSYSTGTGGGISNREGDVIISNSSIHGNTSGYSGGGAELTRTALATISITNSTVSGNESGTDGAGIDFNIFGGYASVSHSTISSNSASDDGGGIRVLNGRIHLDHSIVARNFDNSDVARDIHDLNFAADPSTASYSLIGDNSGTGFMPAPVGSPDGDGNLIGTAANRIDPQLRPLSEWGGFTQTHLLENSSPAVDSGDPLFVGAGQVDQQGKIRAIDGNIDDDVRVDMGASELVRFEMFSGNVDKSADELDGNLTRFNVSLRERVTLGRFQPGLPSRFFFSSVLPGSVSVSLGEIPITSSMTIESSGLPTSINAGGLSRIFSVDDGTDSSLIDVQLIGVTLTGGATSELGGAIRSIENLTIERSTITGNQATAGGGIEHQSGILYIRESTISGNSAANYGGGVAASVPSGRTVYISNSTIVDNTAGSDGGGIDIANTGGVTVLNHATVTGNVADSEDIGAGNGGGVHVFSGSVFLQNSIVAENDARSGDAPDVSSNVLPYGSLIGDNSDSGLTAAPVGSPDANDNLIGTAAAPIDPQLLPLANNGGVTETRALLSTSPAIDAGISFGDLFDQRGDLFPRTVDGNNDLIAAVDMGAFEYFPADITLHVDVADGFFDGIVAPGHLSLTEAVTLSNIYVGRDAITFDESIYGSTITLTDHQMKIIGPLDITGPGADQLTIDGDDSFRIFDIESLQPLTTFNVSIDGLHLTGGNSQLGGAIRSFEDLKITNSSFTNNFSEFGGGAIRALGGVEIRNSSLTGNVATQEGGALSVSVFTSYQARVLIENTTISGNSAGGEGGGLWVQLNPNGYVNIRHSTIIENSASDGGGIRASSISPSTTSISLDHSIVALNTRDGGTANDFDLNVATTARYSFLGNNEGSDLSAAPIGSPDANGNMIGTPTSPIDPDLSVLGFDGGPTLSHGPLPGSPVEDAGDPNFAGNPYFDQRGIPYDRVFDGRIDIGAIEFQPLAPLDGDFDNDGDYDCQDVNMLTAQIASGGYALLFDILPDGNNDQFDLDAWLAEAGQVNLGLGESYQSGDANLDGNVNGDDFVIWSQHKFTSNSNWCDGDFNASGTIDGRDFLIWNANKLIVPAAIDITKKPHDLEPTTERADSAMALAASKTIDDLSGLVRINTTAHPSALPHFVIRRSDKPQAVHTTDRPAADDWLPMADEFFATLSSG